MKSSVLKLVKLDGMVLDLGLAEGLVEIQNQCRRGDVSGTLSYIPPGLLPPYEGCDFSPYHFDEYSLGVVMAGTGTTYQKLGFTRPPPDSTLLRDLIGFLIEIPETTKHRWQTVLDLLRKAREATKMTTDPNSPLADVSYVDEEAAEPWKILRGDTSMLLPPSDDREGSKKPKNTKYIM